MVTNLQLLSVLSDKPNPIVDMQPIVSEIHLFGSELGNHVENGRRESVCVREREVMHCDQTSRNLCGNLPADTSLSHFDRVCFTLFLM